MSQPVKNDDSAPNLAQLILDLCARAERGRTISPSDAAQAYSELLDEGELGWRAHLQNVRTSAVKLAEAGRLVIYRKGKPVDPHEFRGVYRLGAPRSE